MISLNKIALGFLSLLFFLLTACGPSEPALKPLLPSAVILAFGDSLTYGTGATPETNYPSVLEQLTQMKVINAGVPGEETSDALLRINKNLDEYQPKLVIVCLGGNDLLRHRSPVEIKENLKKIIRIIQNRGIQVILVAVPTISYNLFVPEFYQELGDELHIPVDVNTMRDLFSHFEYKSDYIHLNAAGYKVLAEKIALLLKKQGAI